MDVLNHGHVGLVDSMGSDLSIVRNARVSYGAGWRAGEDEGSDIVLNPITSYRPVIVRYRMKFTFLSHI